MPEEARAISKTISTALCIPSIVADLMVQRGIKSARDGEAFLRADLADLEDPHLLKDIDKAVERISRGIEENERIVVYGDYDVDGITRPYAFLWTFLGASVQMSTIIYLTALTKATE